MTKKVRRGKGGGSCKEGEMDYQYIALKTAAIVLSVCTAETISMKTDEELAALVKMW